MTFAFQPGRPVLFGIDLGLRAREDRRADRAHGRGQDLARSPLIPRFYDVETGRVTIDGADVRDVSLTSLRREIGIIAQDPFLFSASVRDNSPLRPAGGDRTRRSGRRPGWRRLTSSWSGSPTATRP